MSRVLLSLCVSIMMLSAGHAQDIPVRSWRNHFSYESIQLVASDGDRTFAASELALFLYEDAEITRLSKIEGLNGGAITGLAYRSIGDVLLIGYENGGIDLIQAGKLTNLTDLNDPNFGSNRSINGFTFNNERAFAATNFGIATINLNTQEVTEIFREIGPNGDIPQVDEIFSQEGLLYATTSTGVQSGDLTTNLLDFNNWRLSAGTSGFENLTTFQGALVASRDSLIFSLNPTNDSWDSLAQVNFEIQDLYAANGQLFVLGSEDLLVIENGLPSPVAIELLTSGSELVFNQGSLWIADRDRGLINSSEGSNQLILPSGPASDDITNIEFVDDLYAFYAAPPGITPQKNTGFSLFTSGQWNNYEITDFNNISDVAMHEGSIYLSSNSDGLYNFTDQQLVGSPFSGTSLIIPALSGTSDGLYALCYDHSEALYRLNEGTWESWSAAEVGSNNLVDLELSQENVLWLTNGFSSGIIAFDPIGGQNRVIDQGDGLASASVQAVAIDLDDQAWIATLSGTAFFIDATFVFDDFDAFIPFFENRVLFEEEAVTAIAVDGGNRKWMATKDGIWIFDRNVITLENRFTTENSPLPSNNILDFAYDPESGEMFILTDRGLVSYRTGSSAGDAFHSNVEIFPNPIRPQDVGPVTLRGLAQNVNVKITDVQGNLVREVEALGGTATWDLRDTSGGQAVSGIYLFFSSTGNRDETFIGKIAVIR